tara:strand:+ start:287 stop:844 length:558 start_codon:yes stop_codon:yes gene_type:complete
MYLLQISIRMREQLREYFSTTWLEGDRSLDGYTYTGWSLVDKIQPNETVLDIGCGTNPFKDKIPNLWGIDITDVGADEVVAIEDYYPNRTFDVAFCLGSINFGAEEFILEQCAAIDRVVHPEHGRVYWRCNPGKKDHGNTACEDIDFFPWNFDLLNYYAYKNNFKCYDLQKDGRRLYSEWRRHST